MIKRLTDCLEEYGSHYRIRELVREGKLFKLEPGIYSDSLEHGELEFLLAKYPRAVVTLDSAYHYYNLTDELPDFYYLATDRDDGKIKVLNSGYLKTLDGEYKESIGKAKARKNGTEGQLQVSFFGPFYADYDILELAPDYSYSVVGSSSPRYLWILSRTPHLSTATKDKILRNLRQRGYDTSKLIWVEQR